MDLDIVTSVAGGRNEADRWVKSLGTIIRSDLETGLVAELFNSEASRFAAAAFQQAGIRRGDADQLAFEDPEIVCVGGPESRDPFSTQFRNRGVGIDSIAQSV